MDKKNYAVQLVQLKCWKLNIQTPTNLQTDGHNYVKNTFRFPFFTYLHGGSQRRSRGNKPLNNKIFTEEKRGGHASKHAHMHLILLSY